MNIDNQNIKFEEAIEKLEACVKRLESGSLSLDDAIKLYEEAIGLVRICHGKLDNAEKRIRILVEADDGTVSDRPFGDEDAN